MIDASNYRHLAAKTRAELLTTISRAQSCALMAQVAGDGHAAESWLRVAESLLIAHNVAPSPRLVGPTADGGEAA